MMSVVQKTRWYADSNYLGFGNSQASPDAALGWNTAQTVDALYLGLSAGQNTFVIGEYADRAFDFAHGAQTNPTVFIHSAVQNTTQWLSFAHDQTNGVITVGTGSISLASATIANTFASSGATLTGGTVNGMVVGGVTPAAGTFTALTGTSGSITGLTALAIRSTGAAFDLTLATATVFTAGRTLTIDPGDAARTITFSGNPTLADWFDQSVKTTANPTFGNLTITSFAANWTNAGRTVADLGTVTTVDINGGTLDGVTIGGASAAAITGTTITVNTNLVPDANDGAGLGISGTAFSDLFLASGAVINFFAGDMTITHAADTLTFAGGDYVYTLAAGENLTFNASAHTEALGVLAVALTTGTASVPGIVVTTTLTADVNSVSGFSSTVTTGGFLDTSTNSLAGYVATLNGNAGDAAGVLAGYTAQVGVDAGSASAVGFFAVATGLNYTMATSGAMNFGTLGAGGNITFSPTSGGVAIETYSVIGSATLANAYALQLTRSMTLAANTNGAQLNISGGGVIGEFVGASTHPTLGGIIIDALTFTNDATATTTNVAALYIEAAPTGVTPSNGPYSIFVDAGGSRFDGRVLKAQGADVASATNLTLGSDGNTFELTGTTKVDLIVNTGWTEGSVVTLIANESVVIDHGTATSGANVQIRLAGAVDYSMTAGDTLTLVLSSTTAEGQAWREISRAVI